MPRGDAGSENAFLRWKNTNPAVHCPTISQQNVDQALRKELVEHVWAEVSQTDEIKRNLEKLQPVIERVGY